MLIIKIIKYFFKKLGLWSKSLKRIPLIIKLNINGVKFKSNIKVNSSLYINNNGQIILGENVFLNSYPNGSSFRTGISTYLNSASVIIGDNCKLNGTLIHCNEKIIIEKNCMFGPGTILIDNNSHCIERDCIKRRGLPKSAPIIIHENVWIGMNCTILKGVVIGENSIVAACSVVTKNIPSNCLYGGNPAKKIRDLI